MKSGLEVGRSVTRSFTVDRPRTVDFLGAELRLYGTPQLIYDIEVTCRDLLMEFADPGENSVGTDVRLAHTGATLLGDKAEITATVKEINGKRVRFSVVARDSRQQIATGEHERAMVEVEKLRSRVAAMAKSRA